MSKDKQGRETKKPKKKAPKADPASKREGRRRRPVPSARLAVRARVTAGHPGT